MSVFWIHPNRGVSPQRRHRSTQSFRRYRHRCKVSWRRDATIKIFCRFEVDALKLWKYVRWCRTCCFNNIFTDIEIFFSPDTSTSLPCIVLLFFITSSLWRFAPQTYIKETLRRIDSQTCTTSTSCRFASQTYTTLTSRRFAPRQNDVVHRFQNFHFLGGVLF